MEFYMIYRVVAFFFIVSTLWHTNIIPVIRIGFAGDVMLGRLVSEKIKHKNPTYVWGTMLPFLKANDLNVVNLETTFTDSMHPVPKVFNFKADPRVVKALKAGSIEAVNIANNHILDFDVEGLKDTLTTLNKAGIKHTGAGMNDYEAAKPIVIQKKGLIIGIISYTDNEPSWESGSHKPGTRYLRIEDAEKAIKELKKQVDLLIVSLHWGPNWQEEPPLKFKHFAHRMIDAGADIIHGHSNHTFQGYEWYKGKLILYQTGDFVDDYAIDMKARNDRSFLFIVDADREGPFNLHLIPTIIQDGQVNQAEGNDARESLARIQQLSTKLVSDSKKQASHKEVP